MSFKKMIVLCLYRFFMADSIYLKKEELELEEYVIYENVIFFNY